MHVSRLGPRRLRAARIGLVLLVPSLLAALPGGAPRAESPNPAPAFPPYSVKVHEFEGCECNSVCPCIFSSDDTYGDCRGITVFTFTDGTFGSTALHDVSCALVFTWAGANMEATMGKWRGVLYTSEEETPAEHEAVLGLVHAMMGDAFAKLDLRTAPLSVTRQGDVHDLTVGSVAHLRIHGIQGPNGDWATVRNAPSPLAYPVMVCALADVHTYDDGEYSWSFPGRNGFFADFDLASDR